MGGSRGARVRCPVCDHVFRAPSAGTHVVVGRESDLCPKFPGRASDAARLIRAGLTLCPVCSFAAGEDFAEIDLAFDVRFDVRERLKEDGLLKVFRANPPSWFAFHAAEICGQERDLGPRELGDLCLRASWVCRKEREKPFESTFQLRALRYFLRALRQENLGGRELSVTTYLVGELNRRLGNHREALNWYVNAERTLGETSGRDAGLAWLERLISEQKERAREQAA